MYMCYDICLVGDVMTRLLVKYGSVKVKMFETFVWYNVNTSTYEGLV